MRCVLALIACICIGGAAVMASSSDDVPAETPLADPALERRARSLMREIRCVACENEPISQSASDISIDMRRAVRSLIADGASDEEVRAWFAQRYGQFVLFRPPTHGAGWLIWLFPFALLAGGAMLMFWRRKDH